MPERLKGRNIIITGAAGQACSIASILMLEKVRDVLANSCGRLVTCVIDVSNKSEVEQAVNHLGRWGGLDVIFNNAGTMYPYDVDAHECPSEIWDKTFDISIKGVYVINNATYTVSKGTVMAPTRELAIIHAREERLLQKATREVYFPTGCFGEAIEQADESSFINAHDMVVDGGLTKAYVTPEGPATEAPRNLGKV
ncbi:hypothetical protein BDP55DRAFT_701601 [Colletotrichum godetiae]|uniref:Uncharacterized protein n=1 Tax=Colletotrichum godetiae TaxID=1209918 RepID=A0AAJ0EX16_9PEZI|nr:uncharacterized protein BDP55DRAFT_701601 [Colletotrichum godetiae]KAK1690519.1 hypothetical protein BDP55DRAFT_701601 [Colletotrichum godetiae]